MSHRTAVFLARLLVASSPPSQPPAPGAPVMGFYHNDSAEVYIVARFP